MTVIEEIRERRELLGMTQADAARIANVRQWREIEAGFCDPTAAALGTVVLRGGERVRLVQIDAPEVASKECYRAGLAR